MFQTLIHPTDFDEPSREAFRVARSLAQTLGARLVALHIVPPPAVVTQDGRAILDPHNAAPVDLWAEYRTLRSDIHEEASVKTKEQDEFGTSQTSIRHHLPKQSAMKNMRLLPFTPAASQCAMSDPGMQPESRSRS